MCRKVLVAYATNVGSTADATPLATFPGRLDPMSARGFMARRLARVDFAGDFREGDQVPPWACGLSGARSSVEMSSWTTADDTPQHNDPEGVAP